jgi:hypothetical protein
MKTLIAIVALILIVASCEGCQVSIPRRIRISLAIHALDNSP